MRAIAVTPVTFLLAVVIVRASQSVTTRAPSPTASKRNVRALERFAPARQP